MLRSSLTVLAAGLALSGCGDSHGAQQAQMGPTPVGVITVQAQSVTMNTELSGRTSAFTMAEVRPQVSGIILKRLFTEGGQVRAGQALYQIDPSTYRADLDSAQASYEKAQANLTTLGLKADRYKQLISINAVGQQELDDAVAAQKAALADVASARAAVETARINLGYTRVLSPVTGLIGKSTVTQGALVTANQAAALATVQQLDPMYVDVTQSMSQLLQLRHDMASGLLKRDGANQARVKLTLEDGSVYPLEGKLQFSDVTVDQDTGAISLRAVFPNPKHDLLPGMYVRAQLEEGVNSQAIMVPQSSVTHDNKGDSIAMVVGPDNKVQVRMLQVNRAIGSQWLLNSGLKPGDKLIVDGLQKIRPGAPVKAVPAGVDASAASTGE